MESNNNFLPGLGMLNKLKFWESNDLDRGIEISQPDYGVGELPLAWGTSLALESLNSDDNQQVLKSANELRVNILTLLRNSYEVLNSEIRNPRSLADYCLQDMRNLVELVPDISDRLKLVFYYTDAIYYRNVLPKAVLKQPRTPKQKEEFETIMRALKHVINDHQEVVSELKVLSRKEGTTGAVCLMLTHVPADLLCKNYYAELLLLESHTGAIKKAPDWSSKIVSSSRADYRQNIPFNVISLTVLGDGNKFIEMSSRRAAKAYYDLAKENKWNVRTTEDKIMHDIKLSEKVDDLAFLIRGANKK